MTVAPSCAAAIAASVFLVGFRGLPLGTVEVEQNGEKTEIDFSDKYTTVSIILPKYKQLLEKTLLFQGNIENYAKLIFTKLGNKTALAIHCTDAKAFDIARLKEAFATCSQADFCIAYSESGGKVSYTSFFPSNTPDSALYAICAACEGVGKSIPLTFFDPSGNQITLTRLGTAVRAVMPCPKFMRLIAPLDS